MRVNIELRLIFKTPVNIGSDVKDGTFADRPLRKDKHGWPYIPATSLRGRVRHRLERLARTLDLKPPPCAPPLADSMCQVDTAEQICPVCQIFGSPWHPSPLRFTDLKLVEPAFLAEQRESIKPAPSTILRYGVALSRHRRVAEENLLFTTEVFSPGVPLTFRGEIKGDLTPAQLALLVYSLKSLSNLGSSKTSGLGWCSVEPSVQGLNADNWETISIETLAEEVRRWPTNG